MNTTNYSSKQVYIESYLPSWVSLSMEEERLVVQEDTESQRMRIQESIIGTTRNLREKNPTRASSLMPGRLSTV